VLYSELLRVQPGPVVALNRAVAVAMADGPPAGLALLDRLGGALDAYHPFHAARADLLRREGRRADAAGAYRRALELAGTEPERTFLAARLRELTDG
jgi:RNA polymerase sigma-70 factor (ECF subfamily)